jgi:hypothetical protein
MRLTDVEFMVVGQDIDLLAKLQAAGDCCVVRGYVLRVSMTEERCEW